MKNEKPPFSGSPIELADEDILAAMKRMQGFIDITPADFKEIYCVAFRHAVDRIARSVRAEEIMTRDVITVFPDTPLAETAERMARAGISGLPVVETGNVVGVISEKDFLHRMGVRETASFMAVIADCLRNKGCVVLPIRGKVAGDIMSAPAVTVEPERPIIDITALFNERRINRVPVVDGENRLAGIVSRGDIVASYLAKICG